MKNSTFAERFSEALRIRDKKPAELSKITDIPESAISNYRNGNYEAKQERVYILSNALNVSPAWLMGYDVPMEPNQSIPQGFEPLPPMARKPIVGDIACGTPILAEDEVTSSNLVSSSIENTRKPAKTKGLRVFLCWFLLSDFCAEKP